MNINSISKKLVGSFDLFFWEKIGRFNYVKRMAKERVQATGKTLPKLTSEQNNIIETTFGKRYRNSLYIRLYNNYLMEGSSVSDYIPDNYYMDRIEPYFNKPLIARKNEDKNLYDLFFSDINMPHTVVRYVDGVFLNSNYNIISEQEAMLLCKDYKELIIKTASESGGGHGISFWSSSESINDLVSKIKTGNNIIVQEIVNQHPEMAKLHQKSINTLRIMTILFEGKVNVMTHFVRMGVEGKRVDNVSSGGMLCGINDDGSLQKTGYDDHGRPYVSHPTSGTVFEGFKIPNYDQCIALVKKAAPRLSHFAKLISWDVAIDETATPVLIEANLTYCDVGIYQIACGPLLGNNGLKEKILKAVSQH